jgi:hypothetical protein
VIAAALMAAPFAAAQTPAEAVDLASVGKPPSAALLAYEDDGGCSSPDKSVYCRYISPAGVQYTVIKGVVCNIDIGQDSIVQPITLPYGLAFGASVEDAIAGLPRGPRGERRFTQDGRTGFEAGGGVFGDREAVSDILLWFDLKDRLSSIHASAGCS